MGKHPEAIEPTAYDRTFNLLYLKIGPAAKTGILGTKYEADPRLVYNLGIYDIAADELRYFFAPGTERRILHLIYETEYNDKLRRMEFSESGTFLFNNYDLDPREQSDRLFVVAQPTKSEAGELWVSNRRGEAPKLVRTFDLKMDWRIDVYNQKLLFVEVQGAVAQVHAYDW
ncbi:MAG: hypothetical protein AAFW73_25795 [Bacteroidota bacterium]